VQIPANIFNKFISATVANKPNRITERWTNCDATEA